jgi:hypothetical protein
MEKNTLIPPINMKNWTVYKMRDYLNATTAANHLVGCAEVVLLLGPVETMVPNASLQGQIHCHTMLRLYTSSKVHCTSHFIQT